MHLIAFFKAWQCGGSVELVPCSRVGHLYRPSVYSFEGDSKIVIFRNYLRFVRVWMDEFQEYFYATGPSNFTVIVSCYS